MKLKINYMLNNLLYKFNKCCLSTIPHSEALNIRKNVFTKEKLREESLVTRIDKMKVDYRGLPSDVTLMMNRNISTPFHCAMHIHEFLCQQSVLAEVNGELWDMHRPLTESCELRLLNFNNASELLNKVYWRSCSFLLGMIIENAFKDEYFINLHSWPKPNIYSGSFVYDADIGIANWKITTEELKVLTTMFRKLSCEDNHFERLDVTKSLALEMFAYNRFKREQIHSIPGDTVTVYRVKDHIDISCGPMIRSSKVVGTSQITAVHQLDNDCGYRFQGVSIPKQLTLNSFAFSIIAEKAKKLNETGLLPEITSNEECRKVKTADV